MAYRYFKDGIPEKGKGAKLSAKMQLFVDEYLVDLNGAQAVIRAGYRSKNPKGIATELLQHPLVRQAIDEKTADRRKKLELSADYVIHELMAIVEDTKTGNPNAALRGLELLGKHLGLYKDRQEISGPDGEAIQMEQKVKQDVNDFTSRLARLAADRGENGTTVVPIRKGNAGA